MEKGFLKVSLGIGVLRPTSSRSRVNLAIRGNESNGNGREKPPRLVGKPKELSFLFQLTPDFHFSLISIRKRIKWNSFRVYHHQTRGSESESESEGVSRQITPHLSSLLRKPLVVDHQKAFLGI